MKRSDKNSRLIIVCGLPGSGKTTYAKQLERSLPLTIRLSPDEWMNALSLDISDELKRERIEALQWKLAQELFACGLTVVLEWGTWGRSERDRLRLEARSLGAAVELHYLHASVDVLFDRIQRRGTDNPPIKLDMILQWSRTFQPPTAEEMALFDSASTAGPLQDCSLS